MIVHLEHLVGFLPLGRFLHPLIDWHHLQNFPSRDTVTGRKVYRGRPPPSPPRWTFWPWSPWTRSICWLSRAPEKTSIISRVVFPAYSRLRV